MCVCAVSYLVCAWMSMGAVCMRGYIDVCVLPPLSIYDCVIINVLYMCLDVGVCMCCVCMYACMHVCMYVLRDVCVSECLSVCLCGYTCMCRCARAGVKCIFIFICMFGCVLQYFGSVR